MKLYKLKYFILLIIGIFLLIFSIFYFNYQNHKEDNLLKIENTLKESSQNYSVFMNSVINPLKTLIEDTGIILSEFEYNNPSDIESIFNKIINDMPLISSMYFVNEKNGSEIKCGGNSNSKIDLRNRFWYVESRSKEKSIITPVYKEFTTQKPVITLSYAIRINGSIKGVIAADIFLEDFYKAFGSVTYTENAVHYIIDTNGNVVLYPVEKLLGFSMFHPQKSYLYQLSDNENKMILEYVEVLNGNTEVLLKNSLGKIYYSSTLKEKIYGYFHNVPNTNWIIISRINYEKVETDNLFYLIEISSFGFVIFIVLGIFSYFVFIKIGKLDDLTGLYRKNKLLEVVHKDYNAGKKIILFMDMYNFSVINGNYGSKIGDKIIKRLSKILKNNLHNDGLLIHSRADDFLFLFNTDDWSYALQKTELLNKSLKDLLIVIDDFNININVFLCLTKLNPIELEDVDTSILLIEDILNYLKKTNKKSLLVYPDSHELLEIKKQIDEKKERLIKAIEEDRIIPFFQPIYDIKENKTEKYEVLMRIKEGENYLSPFPYIKIAEENNLIEKIDLTVIQKAFKYKSEVDPKDLINLSINVSGKYINDINFLPKIVLLAERYNIKYKNIILEITETQSIDDFERLINTIHAFKDLGFKFSIDDFGTGFSSIQYLKRIPADYLKIDGSFIRDLNENKENLYLVKSIVSMAKVFNMTTIAEYVENEEILNRLKEIGIDYAQGYYIGKPNKSFI